MTGSPEDGKGVFIFNLLFSRKLFKVGSIIPLFDGSKLQDHIAPFLYKNGVRFCSFALIYLITNTEPKISVLLRLHCSSIVKVLEAFSKTSVFLDIHI